MEQVLDWVLTVLGATTAGLLAMAPGMIFWLVIVSIYMAIRRLGHSGPFERLLHGGEAV